MDQQTSELGRRLAERTDVMIGAEPNGLQRFRGRQAKLDVIQHRLQRRLILTVATGNTDSQYRFHFFAAITNRLAFET